MELNVCRLWTEPRHFKYTLPSANRCIYLNRSAYPRDCCEDSDWSRIQTSELSLISSKTCALSLVHLCEEVNFRMPLFVTRVIVSAPHFFLCRTNPWVKYLRNSIFFNFERMLYWYEMKAYILKNLFLSYFIIKTNDSSFSQGGPYSFCIKVVGNLSTQ